MSFLCQMSYISGLTLVLLAMSTGSPVPWSGENGIWNTRGNTRTETPEIELQLEDLKATPELKEKSNDAPPPPPPSTLRKNETLILKTELNLEKPTVSDNSAPESILDMGEHWDKRGESQSSPSVEQHLDIGYTPHDVAEYIFWTGDEMGVSLLLSELLENDMISKDATITFLELVKKELEGIKSRYVPHGNSLMNKKTRSTKVLPPPESSNIHHQRMTNSHSPVLKMVPSPVFILEGGKQNEGSHDSSGDAALSRTNSKQDENEIWAEYVDMPEKVDSYRKEKEYALEKGMHQLAHDLFSKAANENPALAMKRLARFVNKLAKL